MDGVEPVEFSPEELQVLKELTREAGVGPTMTALIRTIARHEIASLAGLALRRTQDRQFTRSPERNLAMDVANEEAAQFWGEVLAEYGGEE